MMRGSHSAVCARCADAVLRPVSLGMKPPCGGCRILGDSFRIFEISLSSRQPRRATSGNYECFGIFVTVSTCTEEGVPGLLLP